MILITVGVFYCEGQPIMVARSKKDAIIWLKDHGWKNSSKEPNKDLFEKFIDGTYLWAKLTILDVVDNDNRKGK